MLRVVTIYPNVIHGRVVTSRVILEPFPFEVGVSDYEARLVVEAPCLVKLCIPLPEPLPEIDILLGPGDPAKVLGNVMLCVLAGKNI